MRRALYLIFAIIMTAPLSAVAGSSPVLIGVKIEQIKSIDQKQKNFTVVASLRIDWTDSRLAFEPDNGEDDFRVYALPAFKNLLQQKQIRWPAISMPNLQGSTGFENQIVQLKSDGLVNYLERFTATFQAPSFDFRRFPLDRQTFYIHVDSVFPDSYFVFAELPDYSGVSEAHGEEEWTIRSVSTSIGTQNASGFEPGPRFTLEFEAERHVIYYVMKLLVPIALIIMVSWFSFFLRDYGKRIDLAGANLLLFIAFNFTVSNDIPRLGYITLLDAFMVATFVVTAMVVLVNVVLRRLEADGRTELARQLDVYAVYGYPLAYFVGITTLVNWFL